MNKEQDLRFYGLVSEYHQVPLFDKDSTMTHTFERSLYDRREKEVDKFARAAGFKQVRKSKHSVSFARVVQSADTSDSKFGNV